MPRHSSKVLRQCRHCGAEFVCPPRVAARGGGKYCSQRCCYASRKGRLFKPLRERFAKSVAPPNSFGCLLWTGGSGTHGYGVIGLGVEVLLTHRVGWELANGPVPDGLHVLHKCDVYYPAGDPTYRRCVNPAHLFLGTNQDNVDDKVRKGRLPIGADHPGAILTEESVRRIRAAYAAGGVTQQSLADAEGVHIVTVNQAINRRTWKHVT